MPKKKKEEKKKYLNSLQWIMNHYVENEVRTIKSIICPNLCCPGAKTITTKQFFAWNSLAQSEVWREARLENRARKRPSKLNVVGPLPQTTVWKALMPSQAAGRVSRGLNAFHDPSENSEEDDQPQAFTSNAPAIRLCLTVAFYWPLSIDILHLHLVI